MRKTLTLYGKKEAETTIIRTFLRDDIEFFFTFPRYFEVDILLGEVYGIFGLRRPRFAVAVHCLLDDTFQFFHTTRTITIVDFSEGFHHFLHEFLKRQLRDAVGLQRQATQHLRIVHHVHDVLASRF